MNEERLQFYALYLVRFASGFGFITLVTLLPEYVNTFRASGLVVGLYTTAFTFAQTVAVVPLAWAGDRSDKRLVPAGVLALGAHPLVITPSDRPRPLIWYQYALIHSGAGS